MSTEWIDYLNRAMRATTQKALAEAAGVDQSTISRWRRGQGVAAPETAIRLARNLGTEPLAALVAAGHLSADDANAAVTHTKPASLTDDQLIDLLRDRLVQAKEHRGQQSAPTTTAVSATATTEAINAVLERPREQLRRDLELAAKRSGSSAETRVREYRDVINRYMSEADDALASLFARDADLDESDAM